LPVRRVVFFRTVSLIQLVQFATFRTLEINWSLP